MIAGGYPPPGKHFHDEDMFETRMKMQIDSAIAEGLADMEAGRCRELTDGNIDEISESIVLQSMQ